MMLAYQPVRSLATLKRASEGKPNIDILDKMVSELGTEKITELKNLGIRFKNFYTSQGQYHPRTGDKPGFESLESRDKVRMLAAMTQELMSLDPSFKKRIDPFYSNIVSNMIRSSKQPTGLWNYSRHPNYFFQWMAWVGYFVFAFNSSGWWTIYCPILMLFLLLRVTGVSNNEKQNLISKGVAYKKYQETTSSFIPFPPKKYLS